MTTKPTSPSSGPEFEARERLRMEARARERADRDAAAPWQELPPSGVHDLSCKWVCTTRNCAALHSCTRCPSVQMHDVVHLRFCAEWVAAGYPCEVDHVTGQPRTAR